MGWESLCRGLCSGGASSARSLELTSGHASNTFRNANESTHSAILLRQASTTSRHCFRVQFGLFKLCCSSQRLHVAHLQATRAPGTCNSQREGAGVSIAFRNSDSQFYLPTFTYISSIYCTLRRALLAFHDLCHSSSAATNPRYNHNMIPSKKQHDPIPSTTVSISYHPAILNTIP